jgi:large-conductance mechanosensitive channel
MEHSIEIILALLMGVGLSAACGFRIFVPLLIVALSARCGLMSLGDDFSWLSSNLAIIMLSVATVSEIVGYYVPVFNHFLDVIGAPCAVIAGTILTASFIGDISPYIQWPLAAIAGGGAAGVIHSSNAVVRAMISPVSAVDLGATNGVATTLETATATGLPILSLIAPYLIGIVAFLMVAIAIIICVKCFPLLKKIFRRRSPSQPADLA